MRGGVQRRHDFYLTIKTSSPRTASPVSATLPWSSTNSSD